MIVFRVWSVSGSAADLLDKNCWGGRPATVLPHWAGRCRRLVVVALTVATPARGRSPTRRPYAYELLRLD